MTKTIKPKHNPDPVVTLHELGDPEKVVTRVYLLKPKQTMDKNTSTVYNYSFEGPSLIHKDESGTGTRTFEEYIDSPAEWSWIQRLMQVGYSVLNAGEGLIKAIEASDLPNKEAVVADIQSGAKL